MLADVIKLGCFVYVFKSSIMDIYSCHGPSMYPTLNPAGDVVIVNKMKRGEDVKAGEVVLATAPTNRNKTVCKRVVAVGGDVVAVTKHGGIHYERVSDGYVWLEGDNKQNSQDSRHYGPVPVQLILGAPIFRIWPLNQIGRIGSVSNDE